MNKRQPYQGVTNIIRFNWHFYVLAALGITGILLLQPYLPAFIQMLVWPGILLALVTIVVSLLVSWYVYDHSPLYRLAWLDETPGTGKLKLLNINAGFDETSQIITDKFPDASLQVCDFYNPQHHTEVSIKRARKAYPPYPGTLHVTTDQLPFASGSFDKTLAILAAHEIRNEAERIRFFKELQRITKPGGHIYVTEHLRDLPNFFAYTIGFLHFHSRKTWLQTFTQAGLTVKKEIKITPFITTFILEPHGNTL